MRPSHLFLGTKADNVRDAASKHRMASGMNHGRHTKPERTARGERAGLAVLTDKIVMQMKSEFKPRVFGYNKLAKKYGVCWSTVRKAVKGETWKHLAA